MNIHLMQRQHEEKKRSVLPPLDRSEFKIKVHIFTSLHTVPWFLASSKLSWYIMIEKKAFRDPQDKAFWFRGFSICLKGLYFVPANLIIFNVNCFQ